MPTPDNKIVIFASGELLRIPEVQRKDFIVRAAEIAIADEILYEKIMADITGLTAELLTKPLPRPEKTARRTDKPKFKPVSKEAVVVPALVVPQVSAIEPKSSTAVEPVAMNKTVHHAADCVEAATSKRPPIRISHEFG
jgi:hypothetical protein